MIYRAYLFDWGNTLMKDYPFYRGPMKAWPKVAAVPGAQKALEHLSARAQCHLITNALDSEEDDIWEALGRVNLDNYINKIFCYKNIGFKKPSRKFYLKVISLLGVDPKKIAVVGDSFENDILGAVNNGIFGYWYNPFSSENKDDKMYSTIHTLEELIPITDQSSLG